MGNSVKIACPCCKSSPPTLVKKYDVPETNMLGQGTFAKVYKGTNRRTQEEVAVKLIDKSNTRRDLLNTEIWILQNLSDHPNIVKCYDMFETEDEVQLVMEIMLGGELFDLLDEHGPYGEIESSKYLRSITSGLAYLHNGNVVHRDLKPENLLLTKKGSAGVLKISDFGLAKILTPEDGNIMKVACGTWIYCAPEVLQLKQKKKGFYDNKCDLFSVGCILFIIMGGYHPFDYDGNDNEELMEECILADTWDFEDPAWKNVSLVAKDLIENMLNQDPQKRLSAAEIRDHPWTVGKIQKGSNPTKMGAGLERINEDSRLRDKPVITVSGPGESVAKPLLDTRLQDDVAPMQGNDLQNGIELSLDSPDDLSSNGGSPRPLLTMPVRRPSVTSTDSRAAGKKKHLIPQAVAFEERRASGDVRRMPKKDRHLHAGDKTETPDMFFKAQGAAAVHITKKGVDNEARWDRFNLSSARKEKEKEKENRQEEKQLNGQQSQSDRNLKGGNLKSYESARKARPRLSPTEHSGEAAPASPHSPSSSHIEASTSSSRKLEHNTSFGSDCPAVTSTLSGNSTKTLNRTKSPSQSVKKNGRMQKYATQQLATRQFANVEEWKAKQAPKLLARTTTKLRTINAFKEELELPKGENKGASARSVKKSKAKAESPGPMKRRGSKASSNSRAPSNSKTPRERSHNNLKAHLTEPELSTERLLPAD